MSREEFLFRNFPLEMFKKLIKKKCEMYQCISDFKTENEFRKYK